MTSAGAKTTPQAASSAPHARAVASRTLTVFGATGGTGQQLVRLALEGGHVVTAVARDPARLATRHDRLAIRPADVLESDSLPALVGGADAVLSALGSTSRAPTTIYSAGVANILEAMRAANVRRCLALSAAPVAPRSEATALERLSRTSDSKGFKFVSNADPGKVFYTEGGLQRGPDQWTSDETRVVQLDASRFGLLDSLSSATRTERLGRTGATGSRAVSRRAVSTPAGQHHPRRAPASRLPSARSNHDGGAIL